MITQTAGSASGYYGWSPEDWCPPRSYDVAPDGQRFYVIQWPPPSTSAGGDAGRSRAALGLIRISGHLSKGEYDVHTDGRDDENSADPPTSR